MFLYFFIKLKNLMCVLFNYFYFSRCFTIFTTKKMCSACNSSSFGKQMFFYNFVYVSTYCPSF